LKVGAAKTCLRSIDVNPDGTYKIILDSIIEDKPCEFLIHRCAISQMSVIDLMAAIQQMQIGFQILVDTSSQKGDIATINLIDNDEKQEVDWRDDYAKHKATEK